MGGSKERSESYSSEPGEFDHIISHDMTNYLNIIEGNTDFLLADVDDPDIVDRLTAIKRQTIAANSLLQTMNGVTRGGAQTQFDVVDVGGLLSTETARLQAAYPHANIAMDIDDRLRAQADELLSSVFANLIENALKHNDSSTPSVLVSAETRDGTAIISVEDNGPGVPDEVRNQLLGRDLAHPTSGTHIIRSLVERYGGGISVGVSQEGTTVTVELPTAQE